MVSPTTFYHQPSNRYYRVDANSMRRHQLEATGKEILVVTKSIDVAIGSGNHAITYLHRTPQGRLLELPLSWYALKQGWAMSPGYDRPDHEDFRREISDSCLFCHSGSPQPSPIGCNRCHGPVAQHLQSPTPGTILNPARLDAKRQLDVCLQCHLQTTSSGIQDSVRHPGMNTWAFQPGMALSDYKMLFARETEAEDRLEINSSGYRLLQSACFQKSEGRMQCTSCHDPHTAKVRAKSCVQCHAAGHAGDQRREGASCESCHMPKRRPVDAIHTSITDHKIAREPITKAATEEDHEPYDGKAVPFYMPADPLTLAAVNRSDDPSVYRQLTQRDQKNVPMLAMLGKVLLRQNEPAEAVKVLERAVALDPACTDCLTHLAVANALRGDLRHSLEILRKAVAGNPDHVLARINLGIAYESLGDTVQADEAYSEAIRLQPDSTEAAERRRRLRGR